MTNSSSLPPEAEAAPDWPAASFLGEAALALYSAAGYLALPAAGALLTRRAKRGKEDRSRRAERFGKASLARPNGPLVWVHAASVGETAAAAPLIRRLHDSGPAILLTTGTLTAADVAARRLNDVALHQFAPIDTPVTVRRFLDHWRPDLALFAESELWPTMLRSLNRRNVPLVVVSARMSERSFRSWQRFPLLARAVLARPQLYLAQTLADADRLRALGAARVQVCGNLKFDVPPPPVDDAVLAEMREAAGDRPILVAASTHPGEEAVVAAAHAELARRGTRLLTVVAPRHPKRGDAVAEAIQSAGQHVRRRSLNEAIDADTDIYLADTIGEMGLWYRLADMAFLGGSLVSRGGQNPIEPAKLRVPVLHGAHVGNFRDVYEALHEAKAVKPVSNESDLAAAVARLIDDAHERDRLAREAYACVERFTGALERILDALKPYLPASGHEDKAAAGA